MSSSSLYSLASPVAQHLWFGLFHLTSIVLSLCAALGCISRATEYFSTFKIQVNTIATDLANIANANITELLHPDLPSSWSFGLSGACINGAGPASKCHFAFPPLFTVEDMIEKSFANAGDLPYKAVVDSWKQALATDAGPNTTLGKYQRSHTSFVNLLRLAAAAIIISLVYTFVCLVLYIIFRPRVAEQYTEERQTKTPVDKTYYVLKVEGKYREVGSDRVIEMKDGTNIRRLQMHELTAELKTKGEVSIVTIREDEIGFVTTYHWQFTEKLWWVIAAAALDFIIVLVAVLASANGVMAGPGSFENTAAGQGRVMLVFSLIGRILCIPIIGAVLFVVAVVVAYFLFLWTFVVLDWLTK